MKTSWIFVELSQFIYKCSISNIQLFLYGQEVHRLYYLLNSEFSLLYFFFPLLFLWLVVIFPKMKYFSISVYSGDFFFWDLKDLLLTILDLEFHVSLFSFYYSHFIKLFSSWLKRFERMNIREFTWRMILLIKIWIKVGNLGNI